jgi:hypothetical protein
MKKYYKIVIGIFAIAGLFYLYHSDLSPGTKTVLLVGVFVVYLLYNAELRLRRIESALRLLEDPTKKEEASKPLSYKVRVSINIQWIEIIKRCFPDLKSNDQVWDFVENLYKDSDLELNKEEGLLQKSFSFVEFIDGLSGINQIWSDYHKTFLDDLEIRGYIFGDSFALFRKFPENKIGTQFRIRPDCIGFRSILPDGDLMEEDKISQIPYYDIINFLKQVYMNLDFRSPMYCVKKFPQKLRGQFDKYRVKYEIWDFEDHGCSGDFNNKLIESKWLKENNMEICEQYMRSHIFTAPYYSIGIQMEIFD